MGTKPYFRPGLRADHGHSVITWSNCSFGYANQIRQNAKDSLRRAGNIVSGHANYPAMTTVYDDIIV